MDRKNKYYLQPPGFFFPHCSNKAFPIRDTILDGELALDTPPEPNHVRPPCTLIMSLHSWPRHSALRFLKFDALVINEENIMQKTLTSRYGVSSFAVRHES